MDSVVHYYGIQTNRCGYCKGTKCSKAYGMHAYTLSPDDYQNLINRGWRRSGQYCYKPHNQSTCCPSYTIKCDALDFKLSKTHKKVLKRMTRFLRDGKKEKAEENSSNDNGGNDGAMGNNERGSDIQDEPKAPNVPLPQIDLKAVVNISNVKENRKAIKTITGNVHTRPEECSSIDQPAAESMQRGLKQQACDSFNTNPPCKKAKQIRLERRQAKLLAKGITDEMPKCKPTPIEKTLADHIADTSSDDKHKLKLVLVPSRPLKVEKHVHAIYRKYQMIVHNDAPDRVTSTNLERFLYKSPLQYANRSDGPPQGYGSFHQQYWLDDKLIAVAVIDILPHCLSSVYFFYDPDYSFLSLGTYASLREIEFVQQLSRSTPDLKYYYMGFYIHACPKMRYKGKLVPSKLLCSEAYTWHLLTDEIRSKLDERKYQRFNPDANAKDTDEFEPNDLADIVIYNEKKICPYWQYVQMTGEDDERDQILEYGSLVGKTSALRIVYVKS